MANAADFLVEIGTEELPPRALTALISAFASELADGLKASQLSHGEIESFATPRRLALRVAKVSTHQPDRDIERLGPPVAVAFNDAGKPTRAATAFADSCGVDLEYIEKTATPKGDRLVFRSRQQGQPATELLHGIVADSLQALPIPKRMRWGDNDSEFVRPVHWIVMLLGTEVVAGQLFGISAGNHTHGHRFLAPEPLHLRKPREYPRLLQKKGFVIANYDVRRERIIKLATAAAKPARGKPLLNPQVLDEVTALVEWPDAHAGRLDKRFLDLPREVFVASLEHHQRYFPVVDKEQSLLPWFIAISNTQSRDPSEITAGTERVVRPRLEDAVFFYNVDKKQSLASRSDGLRNIVFHHKLGSLHDKTERVTRLAQQIAAAVGGDTTHTTRAATLAKCDLTTDMVGEFPELQGTMGRYYALHDGEPAEVAAAIEEHYLPRHAGDDLPVTVSGQALAIADRLDTITAIFAVDEKPTGTRDPYGLRRSALGLLRIIIEKSADLDLEALIETAVNELRNIAVPDDLAAQVYDYIMERLRAYYLERLDELAVTTEMFDAVIARRPARPLDFDYRLRAVAAFVRLDEAASLAAANKRIANILRQSGVTVGDDPDLNRFEQPQESLLFEQVAQLEQEIQPLLDKHRYTEVLTLLASLKGSVDAFFDHVMVMTDDEQLRNNRLALLKRLRKLFLMIADISRLPTARVTTPLAASKELKAENGK